MGKTAFAVMLAVTVAGCSKSGSGSSSDTAGGSGPSISKDPRPAAGELTNFATMYLDFQNAAAGDAKHLGKWITFETTVQSVEKSNDGSYTVKANNYLGEPHAFEILFAKEDAADAAKIEVVTIGKLKKYTFQAKCKGRREESQRRIPQQANSKYVVMFDQGRLIEGR